MYVVTQLKQLLYMHVYKKSDFISKYHRKETKSAGVNMWKSITFKDNWFIWKPLDTVIIQKSDQTAFSNNLKFWGFFSLNLILKKLSTVF